MVIRVELREGLLVKTCVEAKMQALGYSWIRFVLVNSPEDIVLRWQFKLEQQLSESTEMASWLAKDQRDLAYRLTKKIAKQVIPQWFHLLK